MSARHLLVVAAVALIVALAGCGGGGGGGGGVTIVTTNVTGRVVDVAGNGINEVRVQADTGARAIITATTKDGGYYTLPGIPVQTDFTLTVNSSGTVQTYLGVQVGAPFNEFSPMDIVIAPDAPPAASTISIIPADTDVAAGTVPSYSVRLDEGNGIVLDGYPAVWTVSGATGQVSSGGMYFTISPGPVGTTVKLRAMVRLANDHVVSAERSMAVVNPGGGDPPPPPPPTD